MTFGILFAIKIFNVTDFTHIEMISHQSYIIYVFSAFIASAGFSTMFDVPPRLLLVVGIGGIICVCVRTVSMDLLGVGMPIGTFLGHWLSALLH